MSAVNEHDLVFPIVLFLPVVLYFLYLWHRSRRLIKTLKSKPPGLVDKRLSRAQLIEVCGYLDYLNSDAYLKEFEKLQETKPLADFTWGDMFKVYQEVIG